MIWRRFTLIERPIVERAIHLVGMPTLEAADNDDRVPMQPARLLVLDETEPSDRDKGVFLLRFAVDGQVAGDTWHFTVEDALGQASSEYGEVCWRDVPEELRTRSETSIEALLALGDPAA